MCPALPCSSSSSVHSWHIRLAPIVIHGDQGVSWQKLTTACHTKLEKRLRWVTEPKKDSISNWRNSRGSSRKPSPLCLWRSPMQLKPRERWDRSTCRLSCCCSATKRNAWKCLYTWKPNGGMVTRRASLWHRKILSVPFIDYCADFIYFPRNPLGFALLKRLRGTLHCQVFSDRIWWWPWCEQWRRGAEMPPTQIFQTEETQLASTECCLQE